MKIVEHGTRGSHRGYNNNDDELVIHKGGGQIQLSEGEALQLWLELVYYLQKSEDGTN